jgi:hypothetical protein
MPLPVCHLAWASSEEQESGSQLTELRQWAARRAT